MRFLQAGRVALLTIALGVTLTSCGGGGASGEGSGGGGTPPPPTVASVSVVCSPSSITTAQTSSCTATVHMSDGSTNASATLSVPVSMGGITNGVYTPSAVTVQTTVTITATSTETPTISGATTVTVSPATSQTPPTATAVAPNGPVDLGTSQKLVLQITNSPTSVSCSSLLFGQMVVAPDFSTVTYVTPASITPPASASDSLSCPASNGNGQGTVTPTTINLKLASTITSTGLTGEALYEPGSAITPNIAVNGSGFQTGCVPATNPNLNIQQATSVSWNEFQITLAPAPGHFWDPGWISLSTTCPFGGGETSNTLQFGFHGIMNQLLSDGTDLYGLDEAACLVRKFKLSDGSSDGTINVGCGVKSIAYDNVTKYLVAANSTGTGAFIAATGAPAPVGGVAFNGPVSQIVALDHYLCFGEYTLNDVGCYDLNQASPTAIRETVLGGPWNLAMTTVGGSLTVVSWSNELNILTTLSVPALNTTGTVTLSGLTPAGSVPATQGGTQLVAGLGPSAGMAMVLSSYDSTVSFVSLTSSPLTETKRVSLAGLSGIPFRMAANPADGSVGVALDDAPDVLTKFVDVFPSGTVSNLKNTFSFLATGFVFSADGTSFWGTNRTQDGNQANQ